MVVLIIGNIIKINWLDIHLILNDYLLKQPIFLNIEFVIIKIWFY